VAADVQTFAPSWGIAILRVMVGAVFVLHGGQKLFVLGFGKVAAYLAGLGVPAPMVMAVVVTLVEFGCGLALLVGLLTRWATVPLIIDMLVAIVTVHLPNGFFAPRGFEYPLVLIAANVAVMLLGPGAASIDRLLSGERVA
jgi:putative oxidoreductase